MKHWVSLSVLPCPFCEDGKRARGSYLNIKSSEQNVSCSIWCGFASLSWMPFTLTEVVTVSSAQMQSWTTPWEFGNWHIISIHTAFNRFLILSEAYKMLSLFVFQYSRKFEFKSSLRMEVKKWKLKVKLRMDLTNCLQRIKLHKFAVIFMTCHAFLTLKKNCVCVFFKSLI